MKKRNLWSWLLIALGLLLIQPIYGCKNSKKSETPDPRQSLEVIMELTKESYNSMVGTGHETASPIAYHVKMKITNHGKADIQYDRVLSGFIPPRGKALQMETSPFVSGSQATVGNPFRLGPGKTEEYDFTTNGYTYDLMRDAQTEPLVFVMILLRGEEVVYKTPQVALPPLNELPSYELTMFGDNVKPISKKLTP